MKRIFPLVLLAVLLTVAGLWLQSRKYDIAPRTFTPLVDASARGGPNSHDLQSIIEFKKQPEKLGPLKAGGLSIDLAFEDGDSAPELSALILADLQLILGHLNANEFLAAPKNAAPVPIHGQLHSISSTINYVGKGRFIPDSLEPLLGSITEIGGQKKLLISKEMQELYRTAQTLAKNHAAVFDSLPAFVGRLNRLTEEPPVNLGEVIYFGNLANDEARAVENFGTSQFVMDFGGKHYQAPSILEIHAAKTLRGADEDTWAAPLYVVADNGISDAAPSVVYFNGRWQILLSTSTP